MPTTDSPTDLIQLSGLHLRYALTTALIDAGRALSVGELATALEQQGFRLAGRPSKAISDALRWEVARGRVARIGRGTYEVRPFPRQTRAWMRSRLDEIRAGRRTTW